MPIISGSEWQNHSGPKAVWLVTPFDIKNFWQTPEPFFFLKWVFDYTVLQIQSHNNNIFKRIIISWTYFIFFYQLLDISGNSTQIQGNPQMGLWPQHCIMQCTTVLIPVEGTNQMGFTFIVVSSPLHSTLQSGGQHKNRSAFFIVGIKK